MIQISRKAEFSSNYILSTDEQDILIDVIASSDSGYAPFMLALIKELDGDVAKILRILNVGINSNKQIIPIYLYNRLIAYIKEAVVLANYKYFKEDDEEFISPIEMAKTERFRLAYIDRQTIVRTFRKHNIDLRYRRAPYKTSN